jgi:glutamate/tyrosine decarboxylase-like PLP-dependent enzyme/ribosomal protein S18 acetylase RimI-like enzyme
MTPPANCKIIDYQPTHQPFFEQVYREWFTAHFHVPPEPIDDFVLTQPETAILAKQGAILIATCEERLAGFVALKKVDPFTYELTKMAVHPDHRGKGLGEAICKAALDRAETLGAKCLILYSHSSLGPALHIYRKLGFKEVPLEKGLYSDFRCDLKMERWFERTLHPATKIPTEQTLDPATIIPTEQTLHPATKIPTEQTLDPANWEELRQLGHRMVDDMMHYLQTVSERPAWQPLPIEAVEAMHQPLPQSPQTPQSVYEEFLTTVLPYNKNNIHPRFWSWVEGGGTPFGMLADMLASGMNPNLAIGDHAPVYVENQVLDWCKQIFGFPSTAGGVLTSGASMANITALVVARNQALSPEIKHRGLRAAPGQLLIYGSSETHNCLLKGAVVIGIGSDNFRKVPVDDAYRIRIDLLKQMIRDDRAAGHLPFCIIGNAGTVNTGAIDDLAGLVEIARIEKLWFHVDGAFGAVPKLLPEFKARLNGLEAADSLSFDFHKWFYVNYEVGAVLIRDATAHRDAFSSPVSYLATHERGLAGGPEPLSNYGMELSRGFRALKVWMLLKQHGIRKYEQLIRQNLEQAQYLGSRIAETPELELMAPISLNIVCYRYNPGHLDDHGLNTLNKELLQRLQEQGIATPSYTVLNDHYAIRVAITNHRSTRKDFDCLVEASTRLGREIRGTI